jgi:hypothetical protein
MPPDPFMKGATAAAQLALNDEGWLGSQFGTAQGLTFPTFMGAPPVVPDGL